MIRRFLLKCYRFLAESVFNSISVRRYFEPLAEQWFAFSLLEPMAKVVAVRRVRPDVLDIELRPNFLWKGFRAGQFVSLGVYVNGSLQRRMFSISSGEEQYRTSGIVRLSIQKQSGGKVTGFLFEQSEQLRNVRLSQAMGAFYTDTVPSPLLLIAGGMGVTPLLSILKSAGQRSATLLYYANERQGHLFDDELAALKKTVEVVLIKSNIEGRFSPEHLQRYCPDFAGREVFLCGPLAMELHVRTVLAELEFDLSKLKSESFTVAPRTETLGDKVREVSISLSKSLKEIRSSNNKSILEIMEEAGLQPRFGCRMGICNECACKKKSGLVFNEQLQKFSETGEAFIKICSSIPAGDIVLEY